MVEEGKRSVMPPRPRNLLLCFDAFGTLFKPRYPIEQQYGDVARSLGLGPFTNEDVAKYFKAGEFNHVFAHRAACLKIPY
jgi:hypothetical protein